MRHSTLMLHTLSLWAYKNVCRAIEAAADGCSDVIGMAYWWSNCIQLRWMLWAMCHGGEMSEDGSIAEEASGMDEFDWVMKVRTEKERKERLGKNRTEKERKEKKGKGRKEKERREKRERRTEQKRKYSTLRRQFDRKLSIIPGCPGLLELKNVSCVTQDKVAILMT